MPMPILNSLPLWTHLNLHKKLCENKTFIVGSPVPLPSKLI